MLFVPLTLSTFIHFHLPCSVHNTVVKSVFCTLRAVLDRICIGIQEQLEVSQGDHNATDVLGRDGIGLVLRQRQHHKASYIYNTLKRVSNPFVVCRCQSHSPSNKDTRANIQLHSQIQRLSLPTHHRISQKREARVLFGHHLPCPTHPDAASSPAKQSSEEAGNNARSEAYAGASMQGASRKSRLKLTGWSGSSGRGTR